MKNDYEKSQVRFGYQYQRPERKNNKRETEMVELTPKELSKSQQAIDEVTQVVEEAAPVSKLKPVDTQQLPMQEETKSKQELLDEAIKFHDAAVAGDKEAVMKAYDLLKKLHHMDPEDQLIGAYYGSTTSLLGRDAIDPAVRMAKALEGTKILDRVVANAPDNIQVRILRAYVSYRLPEMYFHRTSTAIEDFNYLVSRYEQDNTVFSQQFYWQLLYDLGQAYKTLGRTQGAEATWLKLLSATTDPKYQALLKKEGIQLNQEPAAPTSSDSPLPPPPPPSTCQKKNISQEGIELYTRALAGDKEATRQACDYFSKTSTEEPEDTLAAAYYADCLSLTGRDATAPADMFGNAIKAMILLDNLANSDPDNIQVRYIRAYHSFRLPEPFFRRSATAISDFEYLVQRYEQDNTVLSQEAYWQIIYDLGIAYQRLGMEEQANNAWLKLLALSPAPKYQTLVAQQVHALDDTGAKRISLNSKEDMLKEGIRLHDLGVQGNTKAVKLAYEILEKVHQMDPHDPLSLAYYGSVTALLGRDSQDPTVMFGNAIRGLKMLKQAASRDWQNPTIRLLRAYLAYSLPESFFHLTERAIKDFRFVKAAYEQDNSIIPQELYWQILYDLGLAYQRIGNKEMAKKVWSKLLKQSTDPKYQALLNTET